MLPNSFYCLSVSLAYIWQFMSFWQFSWLFSCWCPWRSWHYYHRSLNFPQGVRADRYNIKSVVQIEHMQLLFWLSRAKKQAGWAALAWSVCPSQRQWLGSQNIQTSWVIMIHEKTYTDQLRSTWTVCYHIAMFYQKKKRKNDVGIVYIYGYVTLFT